MERLAGQTNISLFKTWLKRKDPWVGWVDATDTYAIAMGKLADMAHAIYYNADDRLTGDHGNYCI